MTPSPDYVEPESIFIYDHVRQPSYREYDTPVMQRPEWFTRWEFDPDQDSW